MRYALSLHAAGVCDARTLGDLAALAEDSGWDGIVLEDYLVYQGRQELGTFDPWICLAAMALRTERIVLGMEVVALTRRRPWKVAREAVTLDHLSNGRFILGVGIGDTNCPDFSAFGEATDARTRAAMLDEALDVLVGLWSGEPFAYRGQHYQVDEVTFLPRPLQRPRIPIWVGGEYPLPGPTRRAVRWDGSCLYKQRAGPWTPDDVRALLALVHEERPGATFDVALGGDARPPDWEAHRRRGAALAEAGATWWVECERPAPFGGQARRRALCHTTEHMFHSTGGARVDPAMPVLWCPARRGELRLGQAARRRRLRLLSGGLRANDAGDRGASPGSRHGQGSARAAARRDLAGAGATTPRTSFDRLTVLTGELERLAGASAPVALCLGADGPLPGARLASALPWV